MKNAVAKKQMCMLLIGDLEYWIDEEKIPLVQKDLHKPEPKFIQIGRESISKGQVIGLFEPETVEDRKRLKLGQWKCQKGTWHDRGQKCECVMQTKKNIGFVEGIGKIEYETDAKPRLPYRDN